MKLYLCLALLSTLSLSQLPYKDGIRKKSGSTQCPQGYKQIMDKAECLKVAKGACLSDRKTECDIWSKRTKGSLEFAKNFGTSNQYGCSFDKDDGVLWNTNRKFSGKHNENDDRPICEMDSDYFSTSPYIVGVRKKSGSRECPPDTKPIMNIKECLKVAKGPCLSDRADECKLWSSWAAKPLSSFARNHGKTNQPGCAYDQNDGVIFNTFTKWNGTFNENNDRPVCKYSRPLTEFEFVKSGTCETHGYHSIWNQKQCQDAGAALAKSAEIPLKHNWIFRKGSYGDTRPTGCSWHSKYKNLELWEASSGDCDVNNFGGCFCFKDDFYIDGVRKVSGSNTCPDYYTQVNDVEECQQVAQGRCLSDRDDECDVWSRWVLTDTFAKNHGANNQPGCYYDHKDGVLFNTNTNWSGKFNENADRPICKKDSETFGESKIITMLRELILDARKEIASIEKTVKDAVTQHGLSTLQLNDAIAKEDTARTIRDVKQKAFSAAEGVRTTVEKEYDQNVPGLKGEIEIFQKVIRMLTGLPVNPIVYKDGIRKPGGSSQCPQGYEQILDETECLNVAKGDCLSDRKAECDIWSKRTKGSLEFAKNFGTNNQYGCSFDEDNGVLYNTNTKFSGKHNENTDRPICKLSGAGLVEENEVNVTSFISLADQADPAKVKQVVGLVGKLITAAQSEINDLKKAVDDAIVAFDKAKDALAKASGILKAATAVRERKQGVLDTHTSELNVAKAHASKRVPELNAEIATINQAIDLIKSLEE